jgi:prokaryotic ubiquitin-like protein Pup
MVGAGTRDGFGTAIEPVLGRRDEQMTSHDSGGQSRASRQRETETTDDDVEASTDTESGERREKLSEDVDAILDDIDAVLETNSEEFVRGFVQKGGQ